MYKLWILAKDNVSILVHNCDKYIIIRYRWKGNLSHGI